MINRQPKDFHNALEIVQSRLQSFCKKEDNAIRSRLSTVFSIFANKDLIVGNQVLNKIIQLGNDYQNYQSLAIRKKANEDLNAELKNPALPAEERQQIQNAIERNTLLNSQIEKMDPRKFDIFSLIHTLNQSVKDSIQSDANDLAIELQNCIVEIGIAECKDRSQVEKLCVDECKETLPHVYNDSVYSNPQLITFGGAPVTAPTFSADQVMSIGRQRLVEKISNGEFYTPVYTPPSHHIN